MKARLDALQKLGEIITGLVFPHPLRVAIDGVDAAGKTTLADELAPVLADFGRPVIRSSIDGFHNPRNVRYRQGVDSPQGYYQDSFNYRALLRELLIPLGPDGDRKYRQSIFDYQSGTSTNASQSTATEDAILLFDGIFLMRPELISYWDFCIFVDIDFKEALQRGVERDCRHLGEASREGVMAKYRSRYLPAQRLYLEQVTPQGKANIIFNNTWIESPKITILLTPNP
jgi:uridine kinase